ncbi:MAG: PAS domain S-box protein [Proteobacteria bacterium]|nr:PAS domain S-box protein [Pseudomonadota bacterium]
MKDPSSTNSASIQEISTLKKRIKELEQSALDHKQAGEALRESEKALKESEGRLRNIIESSKDGIIFFDGKTKKIILGNSAMAELLKCSKEDLIGRSISSIHPAEEWASIEQKFQKHLSGGLSYSSGIPVLLNDGSVVYADISSSPVTLDGRAYFSAFFRDITERKHSEKALHESKDRFAAISEGSAIPQFAIDKNHNIILWNKALEIYSGIKAKDMLGHPDYWKAFYKEQRPCLVDLVVKGSKEDEVSRWYGSMFNKSKLIEGAYEATSYFPQMRGGVWLRFTAAVIRDSSGNIMAGIETLDDITSLMTVEASLRESEAKYRSIFENAVEGIFQSTPEGRFISINPATAHMHGFDSPEDMINTISDIKTQLYVNQEQRKKYIRLLKDKGKIENFEAEMYRKDGSKIWTSMNVRAVRDDAGNILYYEGTIEDITKRKEAEEQLRYERQKFAILTENAPLGMALINKNGQFLYINPKYMDIFGYDLSDIPDGKTWLRKAYPDETYRHNVISAWLDDLNNADYGEQRPRVFNATCKDGSTKVVNFIPVLLENGDNIMVCEDITERKRLETELMHAQKMEAIGTLAGGIAHDFNNLLMGIRGYASLMLMEFDPSHPHYEKLTRIENQVQSGANLTNQLLGFARGGSYAVKPININELIEKTSTMFGRTKKEITIHCKYEKNIWAVEVDHGQIEQVLLNLYLNAWQAMPTGGDLSIETKNIVIGENYVKPYLMMPGRYVQTSISDTGVGMDEKTKERIFEPFFTTKKLGRGTGLGLAMVYGIIKSHNGFIDVISVPGKGTTFTLYFHASEKDVVKEKSTVLKIMRGTETILIVDDEPDVLVVNKEILESLGYSVYGVKNGEEAITLYKEKKDGIDLIVLDMIMPGLSGSETFDRIRELNPSVRIILSSGYCLNGQAQQIMDKGCHGFIQKPFDMTQISRMVREILDS